MNRRDDRFWNQVALALFAVAIVAAVAFASWLSTFHWLW